MNFHHNGFSAISIEESFLLLLHRTATAGEARVRASIAHVQTGHAVRGQIGSGGEVVVGGAMR